MITSDYTPNSEPIGADCRRSSMSEAATGQPGLSTAHKCTQSKATFWVGGSLLKVSRPKVRTKFDSCRGDRGIITEFSRQSRRRLQQMVGKTKKTVLPVFVTMTYPDNFPGDPARWKRDLRVFAERFKRAFPKGGYIWRLELIERKSGLSAGKVAPHYHLLVWNVPHGRLLEWVGVNWYNTVGSGDEKHLRAGTRVEELRSWRGAACYVSKYMAKTSVSELSKAYPGGVGRWWGVVRAENLPFVQAIMCPLTESEAITLIRYMRKFARMRGKCFYSLSCFVDAEFWWLRLIDIIYPL